MALEEQKLWIQYLEGNGLSVKDPHEIFTPFTGEQALYVNEDIGTQELRVRVWSWTDYDNVKHEIVDINAWPGDNESGIIAIDGVAVIDNSDQNLSWLPNTSDAFKFDDRLEFFHEIRDNLGEDREHCWCWSESDEIQEDYDNFFASEAGLNAIKLETTAWNDYQDKLIQIRKEHETLREKYLSEFTFIEVLPIRERNSYGFPIANAEKVIDIATSIGYDLKPGFDGKIDDRATFTFVRWEDCKLVTISENYSNNTYLLDSSGKIDSLIYKENHLSDDFEQYDEIDYKLAKRIHSYLKVIHLNY